VVQGVAATRARGATSVGVHGNVIEDDAHARGPREAKGVPGQPVRDVWPDCKPYASEISWDTVMFTAA
jgi:hypothetical protein